MSPVEHEALTMTLDYSQKQLLSKPLHHHHKSARTRRSRKLQVYAALTGFLSMIISLATLVVRVLK